ncbi:DJ-1/PfpI family protein [Pleurocapsa sp. PCC 7319]|uniref:DJ-1/PfpI family protein n=1 Tax=Pleurocapsa sp. PCC 7319 TaxID=118161 RepID=UPI00034D2AD2|nr:DJ-1/PfpI family protein [Pleurocapsa sp. PCC 7319]
MVSTNQTNPKRVAILIENQFEDFLLQVPYQALQKAGAKVCIIGSRMNEEYHGKRGKVSYKPDDTATEVRAEDFDGFLIPVGHIRANPFAVNLIKEAMAQEKAIAVIGYGIQVLIDTDELQRKRVTGLDSLCKDIQNAGANYIGGPVVVDGNLITARRPSDVAILTNSLMRYLKLEIKEKTPTDHSHSTFDWWKLAEDWGGSSRREIVNALNTAIVGERYTLEAFKQYSYRARNEDLRYILKEISITKQHHVKLLETRLNNAFNEQVTWQAIGSEAYAALHSWLQSSDELSILRRALGDIQTGVIDTYHLCQQLTDPLTVAIFDEIKRDLCQYEQKLAEFYRSRSGDQIQPPMPTTMAAVN